jgi:hypothetical protein
MQVTNSSVALFTKVAHGNIARGIDGRVRIYVDNKTGREI